MTSAANTAAAKTLTAHSTVAHAAPAAAPPPRFLSGIRALRADWLGLPAQPASIGRARRAADSLLSAWRIVETVRDSAVLVLSELATNALRHAGGERILCCVGLSDHGLVTIEVHDNNGIPRGLFANHADPWAERGRGLHLVEALTGAWGVTRSPVTSGSAVWAVLGDAPWEDALPPAHG